jgi:hypothetical protein
MQSTGDVFGMRAADGGGLYCGQGESEHPAILLTIGFGSLGNSADHKLSGWQNPERGFTWTSGTQSSLSFARPDSAGRYGLELQVSPFVFHRKLTAQRLTVNVNGDNIATFTVAHDQVLSCEIPWSVLERHEQCLVEFELPDASKPIDISGVPDSRSLALAFEVVRVVELEEEKKEKASVVSRANGRSHPSGSPRSNSKSADGAAADTALKELMMRFESLGEDCEFGLVQRRCGAEPLGLLRFSSTPLPKLINALDAKFEGLGRHDLIQIELSSNGREYMVLDKRFGLYYHAWVMAGEKSPTEIHSRECARLPFLARKLIEDLQESEKLFVYRGMKPLAEPDVLKLVASMRTYGPTTLLWVEAVTDDDRGVAGSVEELAPGLLKGNIDRFAPLNNAHDFSLEAWIEVCRNADCLRRTRSHS